MLDADLIRATEAHVRAAMLGEATGHDWWHVDRVRNTAVTIARGENADLVVVELAALVHDIADEKFTGSAEAGPVYARNWLGELGAPAPLIEQIATIIGTMSFQGSGVAEREMTVEGRCVRDADRLDAIGAIGVARTFAYGGHVGRPIHDPTVQPFHAETAADYRANVGTTVNHFHEKLLLLADRMATDTGRRIAEDRTAFMQSFLDRFQEEWDGRA